MRLLFFLVLLFVWLVFYTPQFVINYMIGKTVDIDATFRSSNGTFYNYRTSHRTTDATRFVELIQQGVLQPTVVYPKQTYPSIALPKFPRHGTFSLFTLTCAYIVKRYLPKRTHKIGMFVSTRHKLSSTTTYEPGNFIVLATYTVHPAMPMDEICQRQHDAVKRAKESPQLHVTIWDMLNMLTCSYNFNSHSRLGSIRMPDGTLLQSVNLTNHIQYKLEDLKRHEGVQIVFVRKNGRYMINKLANMI